MGLYKFTGPLDPVNDSRILVKRDAQALMLDLIETVRGFPLLIAPRQSGKTTLLFSLRHALESSERYKSSYYPVYVNMEHLGAVDSYEQLYTAFLQQFKKAAPSSHTDAQIVKDASSFAARLKEIAGNGKLVLMLDEPEALPEIFAIQFMHLIRSLFNELDFERHIVFVLAGGPRLQEFADDPEGGLSPLTNVTEKISLPDFSKAETFSLLEESEVLRQLETVEKEKLYQWTEGHPYWVQRLASKIEETVQGTPVHVDQIIAALTSQRDDQNLGYVLSQIDQPKHLSKYLKIIEDVLAGKRLTFNPYDKKLKTLELIGVIKSSSENAVVFRNPIYQKFIEENISLLRESYYSQQSELTESSLQYSTDLGDSRTRWIAIIITFLVTSGLVFGVYLFLNSAR